MAQKIGSRGFRRVMLSLVAILFFGLVALPYAMSLPIFQNMMAYSQVLSEHQKKIENPQTGAKGLLCVTWFPEGNALPSERWVLYDNGTVYTRRTLSYSVRGGGWRLSPDKAKRIAAEVPTLPPSTVGDSFRPNLVVVTDYRTGTDVRFYERGSVPEPVRRAIRESHDGGFGSPMLKM